MTILPPVPPAVLADPRFHACLTAAARSPGFARAVLALGGYPPLPQTGLDALIDQATGAADDRAAFLASAVYDLIYCRLAAEVLDALAGPGPEPPHDPDRTV